MPRARLIARRITAAITAAEATGLRVAAVSISRKGKITLDVTPAAEPSPAVEATDKPVES